MLSLCGACDLCASARSIYQKFLDATLAEMKGYKLGDPLDKATNMGPMALPSAPGFLQSQVDEAKAKGAKVLLGGKVNTGASKKARFFEPTLIADVTHDMSVMVEESFGPVVAIMPVSSDEEAIKLMNDSPYGLTAAVFTKNVERFEKIAPEMQCGTVYMNRCVGAALLSPADGLLFICVW